MQTEYKSRYFPLNVFLKWQGRVSAENPLQSIYQLSYLLGASAASTLATYSFGSGWCSESRLPARFLTAHIAPFVSCCTQPPNRLEKVIRKKKKARCSLNVKQCHTSVIFTEVSKTYKYIGSNPPSATNGEYKHKSFLISLLQQLWISAQAQEAVLVLTATMIWHQNCKMNISRIYPRSRAQGDAGTRLCAVKEPGSWDSPGRPSGKKKAGRNF